MSQRLTLNASWLCEAVRLRETQWGPLDDRAARLRAEREPAPERQIASRANVLGETSGLTLALRRFASVGLLSFSLLLLAAVLGGAGSALAALGDGLRPVNVVSALILLLGFNLLSLLVWGISLMGWRGSGGWVAQVWQWLACRLVKGPDVALAGQAWWSMWQQTGAMRWLLSSVTHALWLCANVAMLVVLTFALSTRHFSFVWETTLLSADIFVTLTKVLGALPQWFGFAIPDSETVRSSGHVSMNTPAAQALWAGWLLGALTVYGLVPRVLLLGLSLVMVTLARSRTAPELHAPYYQSVLARMQAVSKPAEGLPLGHTSIPGTHANKNSAHTMITGIELEGVWPPFGLGAAIVHTVLIDGRESRNQVLEQVAHLRPRRLVVACDARHTPDRGTLRLIAELSAFAGQTLVWLQHGEQAGLRVRAWQDPLKVLTGVELLETPLFEPVSDWLEHGDE